MNSTDSITSKLKEARTSMRPLVGFGDYEFVSIAEAAVRTKTTQETLRRAVRAGKIPAYGSRGRLRIRLSDVLQPYVPKRKKTQ